jgi:hypothetical protein
VSALLNPFTRPGRWFRGVFHCHTTNSDGARAPDAVLGWYAERGYDFVSITDHNQLTRVARSPRRELVVVPGTEIDAGRAQLGEAYHILGIGLREMINVPRDIGVRHGIAPQTVIDALRAAGAVVFVAHPYWTGLVIDDLLPLRDVAGIEVWNANTEVDIGKGHSGVHWDDCLSRGRLLLGAANDDAHWRMQDYGRAWTMLRAESLTPASVVEGLAAGAFYASTGAVLEDVSFNGAAVHVRVGAPGAAEIRFMCDRRWGQRTAADGAPLETATYALRGRERYVRIEVVTPSGERAWTNPLFLER